MMLIGWHVPTCYRYAKGEASVRFITIVRFESENCMCDKSTIRVILL
jgi:hypothetical protein